MNLPNSRGFYPIAIRIVPLLMIVALAVLYFWYLQRFAVNIPFQDDTVDVLQFLSSVVTSEHWHTALQHFFNQYNDHRTTASRLIFYAAYLAQGEANFRTLSLLANLAVPVILGLLFLRVRHQQYRWLLLLPTAFVLFQLRAYDLLLWAQAAFAYFFVFLYAFCSIFALHRVNRSRFFLAVVFAILANFTLSSGQLIWLIGLASLLHQSLVLKSSSLRYALCWIMVAIVCLTAWHWDMANPLDDTRLVNTIFPDNIIGAPISDSIAHFIQFFLILLGSAVSDNSVIAAGLAGALLMAAFTWISAKSFLERDIRLELCGWFIVLSAAAITWGRSYLFGVEYALTSRYAFPSMLMVCITWVLLAVKIQKRQPLMLFLGVLMAASYWAVSFQTYPALLQNNINKRVMGYYHNQYQVFLDDLSGHVREAEALGIYKKPQQLMPYRDVYGEPIGAYLLKPP